jgi:hypothetical protein
MRGASDRAAEIHFGHISFRRAYRDGFAIYGMALLATLDRGLSVPALV